MKLNEICCTLYGVAPLHLAQSWDNVGLLAGDEQADCSSMLLTIDLTPDVLDEAIRDNHDVVLAYHPPLFKPISSLRAQSGGTDSIMWQAIKNGIAVYSMHTALDAAPGGTNDVLAELCGLTDVQPFEFTDEPNRQCKVVVFVPSENVDTVADAMSAAGAGVIGEYEECSFRLPGTGTFRGSEQTSPAVGQAGRFETVAEIRLEMIVPSDMLAGVVRAIQASHPYEEPAFDIYPLQPRPVAGIGRQGRLPTPLSLAALCAQLKEQVPTQAPQIVGDTGTTIKRVAICAGAAGSLPFRLALGPEVCLVTGEIRHHDALALLRTGTTAIALGHWASERPVLANLADTLRQKLPDLKIAVSSADRDPFQSA